MELRDVYDDLSTGIATLYDILRERTPEQCIRMVKMPSYNEHEKYVRSKPYLAWYLIYTMDHKVIGHINLSHSRELGIFLYERHTGKGLGAQAIKLLRHLHPGKLYAEVSIRNTRSIKFFNKRQTQSHIVYEVGDE